MHSRATCLATLVVLACLSGAALAHRVNVFAYADGEAIQVECSFSKSRKVTNGKLVVADVETGATLLEGITDKQGMFRFRPSDEFLRTGHGLDIRLLAGEGHQDAWRISPEEVRALSRSGAVALSGAAPSGQEGGLPAPQADQPPEARRTTSPAALDAAELEALIGRVMDAKLAPLTRALARRQGDDPGLRDIVGGIGWILGLLGIAVYMKRRP